VLHAYETVRDLAEALVGMQVVIYLVVGKDAIDVHLLYRMFNLSRVGWVPTNVHVAFPPSVTGFLASDLGLPIRVDAITEAGFSLVGTLPPGQHDLEVRYQVPRDRKGSQELHLELLPRVAQARVILDAGGAPRLEVTGFAPAQKAVEKGVATLIADRALKP